MATASSDVAAFDRLSKQRIDYEKLPNGGDRARMTVTLPNGKTFVFVEDINPSDLKQYANSVAGLEIGCAMQISGIGYYGPEVGNIFGSIAKGIGGAVKAVGKVAKKVVTSKVMQTAAKALAIAAPALGPMAPAALAVSGGIGVAGKLLASKTAAQVGAPLAARALQNSAMSDIKRIAPTATSAMGLLKIASAKASNALNLANTATSKALAKPASNDILALARAGRVRSNQGGSVSPAQLQAAAQMSRIFFVHS